jgi:hypothetical protein
MVWTEPVADVIDAERVPKRNVPCPACNWFKKGKQVLGNTIIDGVQVLDVERVEGVRESRCERFGERAEPGVVARKRNLRFEYVRVSMYTSG